MAEMLKHTRVGGRDKAEERRCDMVARTPASVQAGRGSGEAGSTFRHKPGGDKRLWPATDLPLHPHSQPSLSSSAVIKASCVSAGLFFFLFCSHSVKCSFIKPIFRLGGCSLPPYPAHEWGEPMVTSPPRSTSRTVIHRSHPRGRLCPIHTRTRHARTQVLLSTARGWGRPGGSEGRAAVRGGIRRQTAQSSGAGWIAHSKTGLASIFPRVLPLSVTESHTKAPAPNLALFPPHARRHRGWDAFTHCERRSGNSCWIRGHAPSAPHPPFSSWLSSNWPCWAGFVPGPRSRALCALCTLCLPLKLYLHPQSCLPLPWKRPGPVWVGEGDNCHSKGNSSSFGDAANFTRPVNKR